MTAMPDLPPPPGWEPGRTGMEESDRRPRCAALSERKRNWPGKYPTLEEQGCDRPPLYDDPDGLCDNHRRTIKRGNRIYLMAGGSLPEPEQGELVQFPLTSNGSLRCTAISPRDGEQCSFQAPPGETFCTRHLAHGDPVLGTVETTEDRRDRIVAMRNAMTVLVQLGLQEVQATLLDTHAKRIEKLKAADIILKLSLKTGLFQEVQEAEEDRDLDEEILAITASLAGDIEMAPTGEQSEAEIVAWAAAQGYEVEFVDDEQQEAV